MTGINLQAHPPVSSPADEADEGPKEGDKASQPWGRECTGIHRECLPLGLQVL